MMPETWEGVNEEHQLYKENILDHYKHPRNKRASPHCTATITERNPVCGDVITVYVTVKDGTVQELSFDGRGCAISQAAISMLTDAIKSRRTEEVLRMTQEDILALLGIPVGPVRMKCAMLGLRATQKALGGMNDA
jgi:nitrogen fixation NifU-like protein